MARQPNIFPSPEHVQPLSEKSEPIAEHMRSRMPFATQDVPDVLFLGHEKREPTEQEIVLLNKTQEVVDAFLKPFCEHPPSSIAMEHVRILKPISPDSAQMFPQKNCSGRVGTYLNITLPQFNTEVPEGARNFLHTAIHEFIHAKASMLWQVGERTMKQVTGFSVITAQTPNLQTGKIPVGDMFFVALNEALTEHITTMIFAELYASDWYQTQFHDNEKRTEEVREQYIALHALRDEEISGMIRYHGKQIGVIISYENERKILEILIQRIATELGLPRQEVLSLCITDFCNGTMQHIRPILQKVFGDDALRMLAIWQLHRPEMIRDLRAYLTERDSNIRAIIANNYLTNYKEN